MWIAHARPPLGEALGCLTLTDTLRTSNVVPAVPCPIFALEGWYETTPVGALLLALASTLPKVKTLRELLAEDLSIDTPSIVGSKIVTSEGLVVFAAQPKVGKSLVLQQLALAREFQEKWLGFPTERGTTLYINAEIAEAEFRNRFEIMTERRCLPDPCRLHVESIMGRFENMTGALDLIDGLIKGCCPDLLILDPVSQLLDGEDSSQEYVRPFLRRIDQFRNKYGVAVVLVHHLRKPPRQQRGSKSSHKPDMHDIAGTGLWARNADSLIVGHGKPGGDEMTLNFILRNGASIEPFQIQRKVNLLWERQGARLLPTELRPALIVLDQLPQPATNSQWEKAIMAAEGCKERTAQRRIHKAYEDGWVEKNNDGYSLSKDALASGIRADAASEGAKSG